MTQLDPDPPTLLAWYSPKQLEANRKVYVYKTSAGVEVEATEITTAGKAFPPWPGSAFQDHVLHGNVVKYMRTEHLTKNWPNWGTHH